MNIKLQTNDKVTHMARALKNKPEFVYQWQSWIVSDFSYWFAERKQNLNRKRGTRWNIEERCYISKRFAVCCHVQSTVHRLPIAQHVLRQKLLDGCFMLFCLRPVFLWSDPISSESYLKKCHIFNWMGLST